MKILTKDAYLNSGLEEPFGKINIEVWAKNLVEMNWNKKEIEMIVDLDH